jgi:hypothetical protein
MQLHVISMLNNEPLSHRDRSGRHSYRAIGHGWAHQLVAGIWDAIIAVQQQCNSSATAVIRHNSYSGTTCSRVHAHYIVHMSVTVT